ncbi:unnamed protein product [Peronospora belbahrii]|uniref:Cation-transporting P-type ATPase N-terminal domain-containing protein n=1 Tax=Peronospora belbahrii TaxID=622444 RepID=A0AAU9L8S6_9STRA|nr:unnamed protein product [Peronospora belbahrii]
MQEHFAEEWQGQRNSADYVHGCICFVTFRAVLSVHHSSDSIDHLTAIADGDRKLLDGRDKPETPTINTSITRSPLTDRSLKVKLANSTKDIVQTGYTDSVVGYVVFGYFNLMTVLVNLLIILTICDNQGKLATDEYAAWFNPTTVVIKVFILLWVIATVWFAVIILYRCKILNFFRYPTTLDKCTHVLMYKPKVPETMLMDRSGVAQMVLKVESFVFPHSRQDFEETVTVHMTVEGARYLEFQHLRYLFDDIERKFIPGFVVLPNLYNDSLSDSQGLTTDEHARRQNILRCNAIEVKMPSWAASIVHEFFSLFCIYQLMCYYVWYFTNYVWASVLNTVVIVLAAAFNISAKRSMLASVVKMTHNVAEVTVMRDGVWSTIKSFDLTPGDLLCVEENWKIPCDRQGLNEGAGKKYTLFSGTRTLASGRGEKILAVAQAIETHTSRGQLVQAILHPATIRFKYDEHLKAVFSVLFVVGLIAAYFAMKFLIDNAGLSNTLFAFVYGMFMFSAVLNPLLPVVMTVRQVNAAKRLHKQNIFCLSTKRIILCGKVRIFCFDKTGTITKEVLNTEVVFLLLTRANLSNLLEVKMLKSTQWKSVELEGQLPIVQSAEGTRELEFVKRFEFDHQRLSMSVVMKQKSTGKLIVFCKGSYEKMASISSDSVPTNYFETAENLAKNGCYVLGIAAKVIPNMVEADLSALLAERDAVEIILGDIVDDEKIGSMLVWKDVNTQQVFSVDNIRDMVKAVDTNEGLAVTGKCFDFLVKIGNIQKLLLKMHLQSHDATGDAEASVVSPFTSKFRTLISVVDLVFEGRGALATSFSSVKYLIMYGLIGIGCRTVMYYNGVFISQFLDGVILVGISYGLTRARPLDKMGTQRPTSSLVDPTTVCSLVGAATIHWLFLYGAIHELTTQPWYCPFQPSNVNLVQWWLLQDSNLVSTLWFIVCFQQMSTGLTMGLGSCFRRPIWHNTFQLFWYVLLFVVLVVIFVGPPLRVSDFRVASSTNVVGLPDIPLPVSFRWEL